MKKILIYAIGISFLILIIPTTAFFASEKVLPADNNIVSTASVADENPTKDNDKISTEKKLNSSSTSTQNTSAGYIIYKVYDINSDKVLSLKASDYIKGVVGAEMPVSYEPEALKAQAVAANTYALRLIAQNNTDKSLKGAYFSNDPKKFQAYKTNSELKKIFGEDYPQKYKKISDAVDSVINEIIVYDNQPIAAVFHAFSSGKTENSKDVWGSNVSYLKSVKSTADENAPNFITTTTISADDVKQKLLKVYPKLRFPFFKVNWFKIENRSSAGGVEKVKVGNVDIKGSDLRLILSLKSTNFTVAYVGGNFIFTTKGFGHGVGLSQFGANELAKQGKTYKQILEYYYTGVTIKKVS